MIKLKSWERQCVLLLVLGLFILSAPAAGQTAPWLEPWGARHEITVSNPCGTELTDYQVKITLGVDFDFDGALADGSDLMVTDNGGLDCIPFWVEEWDPGSTSATIWVRVPVIPVAGTSVYLYYGLDSPPVPDPPELMEVGPIGPWDKQSTNIIPAGGPAGGTSLLAENIVYDDTPGGTEHYWLVFANYNNGSVGLAWTDDPDDPTSWTWHGTVVTSANSPHIIYYDGLWHIFFADRSVPNPWPIAVATSPTIDGTYTRQGAVLDPGPAGSWEDYRVDEPYVFQRNDGKWIMMYMGDAGNTTEQVGYAEADDIMGPYTKYAGNPCIPFGPPGSYDAGTVADAWVVELDDVYYVGYTVSSTKSSPWRTALVTTEDWTTFTKHGVILDWGGPGAWDERNAFRGAVTRFGDTYYFPYTGRRTSGGYLMGMATMDAYQLVYPPTCNDPEAVFEFVDNFDGDALNAEKWAPPVGGSHSVSGGICTLTGTPGDFLQMRATEAFGTGVMMETHASHLDAGLNPGSVEGNTAAEVGFKLSGMPFNNDLIRIMDWPDLVKYCVSYNSGGVSASPLYQPTAVDFDSDWHTYRIFRNPVGTADFQIDANDWESFGGAGTIPTTPLYPWLMSYSRDPATQSRFEVDWLRVRKFCGTEIVSTVGDVEYPAATIFGYVYGDGTGLYGVPLILMDDGTPSMPVADAVTDASGFYEFVDLPWGDYSVTVSTPLGYNAVDETQAVSLMGVDVQVDFDLLRAAMTMSQRGRGYWMHQANAVLTGKGKAHESLADMCEYMRLISTHFNQHQMNPITIFDVDLEADSITTLEALRAAISPHPRASMEDKAKAHLTALLLNMVSGKLAQWAEISEDGATVSQAITYCDMLIGDMDPSNDEMAKNVAEMINEGTLVPAGWIDLSTPDYTYKTGSVPLSYGVSQNYPNPFNPSTNVSYSIPKPERVRLEVFNVLGQHVKTLVDGHRAAGRFTVTWHGDDDSGNPVATGIYLFRFSAGDFTETKKMMMLK